MNAQEWFADTGYWLAITNRRDRYHDRARLLSENLDAQLITTDPVLLEVGDALARLHWRRYGIELLADIRTDPDIVVIGLSDDLLTRAFELYAARPDKEWGLTDCVSFVVMQDRGVTEALAADQHFVQAGFRALLRE